ncbi:hypothetical protein BO70DRAFT_385105 [Aspergillus heteromorphus CBS 117.55]|uniref:N-acetylglucosamine-induced protein 1 n=1 Tax=Aspergillus heteromorphus CBS 117.55 TaxID=1448321 RepID=A0A317WW24_9EURO|nr:uncharacterized protein BO70DRAFT_385105 [Aspergillus heteromorphus CBS 117.55]PWY90245.1 hypothetical protein BO70DRAFT_385105 [Aspergillus heteromorphus CBS 117.55]
MVGVRDVTELINNPPFELSAADKESLLTREEDYIPHTWEEIKQVIADGDMSVLKRGPTDLRNYILWTRDTRAKYGSATNFILHERLQWGTPVDGKLSCLDPVPFANPADYRVLRNDWPYGTTPDITHLVVWLRTPLAVDEEGDPTPESRQRITDFLKKTFGVSGDGQGDDRLLWFKNRQKWQSVRAIEHIHVLLRGADDALITKITGQTQDDMNCRAYVPE